MLPEIVVQSKEDGNKTITNDQMMIASVFTVVIEDKFIEIFRD